MWYLGGRYTCCKSHAQCALQRWYWSYSPGWAPGPCRYSCWCPVGTSAHVWERAQIQWWTVQPQWKDLFMHQHVSALPAALDCGNHAAHGVQENIAFLLFLPRGWMFHGVSREQTGFFRSVWDIHIMLHSRSLYFLPLCRITRIRYNTWKRPRGTSAL